MTISDNYSIIDIDYDVNPKCGNIISNKKMSSQKINFYNSNIRWNWSFLYEISKGNIG